MTVFLNRHLKPQYTVTAVNNVAQTLVEDGVGDVTASLTCVWTIEEITGGGQDGGVGDCAPGGNIELFNDAVDIVQLQVAANGAVTVIRTAGADTFNVRCFLIWI